MSYILPLTAEEIEHRLLSGADVTVYNAVENSNLFEITLNYTIRTGAEIKFRAPEAASKASKLKIFYTDADKNTVSKEFAFADANGNDIGGVAELFAKDAIVKVILDLDKGYAFMQNADTNSYLEDRFSSVNNNMSVLVAGLTSTHDGDGHVTLRPVIASAALTSAADISEQIDEVLLGDTW